MKQKRNPGGGRKPVPPGKKKIAVTAYVPAGVVEAAGGLENAKAIAASAIEQAAGRLD